MKALVSFLALTGIFFSVFSQEIPNGNFENWTKTGNYEEPDHWITPNMLLSGLGVSSVKKEFTNVHSGNYSVRLENVEVFGGMYYARGFMTLGMFTFDPNTFESNIFGGIPYTNRPKKFKGYYQYTPAVSGDTGLIAIVLFIFDTLSQKKDTIGGGKIFISQATSGWTKFEVNIDYKNSVLPDSMNIVVLSSQSLQPPAGTVLLIDSLYFDHLGSIGETESQNIVWRYSGNCLNVGNPFPGNTYWYLSDLTGRELMSGIERESGVISIPFLLKGVFILTMVNDEAVRSVKVLIQ